MKKWLFILSFLIICVNAFAVNWCADANNELCLQVSEGTGTDVDDKSVNNSTCTYNGAWGNTSMPAAYMASYLDLDGSNDYVTCGDAAGTDFIADETDFTITFWVVEFNVGNTNERYFTRESGGNAFGWMLVRNSTAGDYGPWLVVKKSGGTMFSIRATDLGLSALANDTHYAILYDYSENKVTTYKNGVKVVDALELNNTTAFGWSTTTDTLCIGARCTDASTQAESHINEIGLFSRLLTEEEVNDIMTNGLYSVTGAPPQIF